MANAAPRYSPSPETAPASDSPWSGAVHGPVAAMHQAIEAGLTAGQAAPLLVAPRRLRPVDALLAAGSRAVGWAALTGTFIAIARLIA